MTTIKADDLTPAQINMLVAVAEGWVPPSDPLVQQYMDRWEDLHDDQRVWPRGMWLDNRDITEAFWTRGPLDYCGVDTHSGRIIDREHIATAWMTDRWAAFIPRGHFAGGYPATGCEWINMPLRDADGTAPVRLEAAMRAYVRKLRGDTIDTTDKPWLLEAAAA